jgi:hypothetical protein
MITAVKKDSGIPPSGGPAVELDEKDLNRSLFRIYTKPEGTQGTGIFGYNRAMLYGIFLVEGFEPLETSRHRKLIDFLSRRNIENLLKITNVKYVTSIESETVGATTYASLLPRAFIVPNAKFLNDDAMVLEELVVSDPQSEVIISGTGKDILGQTLDISGWTAITKYASDCIELRTQSTKDGFLVLSDTYYPGWQAWVDGVASPIMRANYDFRALFLPQGEHTVVFRFRSQYLKLGLLSSLGGVFFVVLVSSYTFFPSVIREKISHLANLLGIRFISDRN